MFGERAAPASPGPLRNRGEPIRSLLHGLEIDGLAAKRVLGEAPVDPFFALERLRDEGEKRAQFQDRSKK
ncbi:hypothetical protein MJD09_22085 [bacterium]|nr:hypothetical protein [bacterium]